MVFLNSSLPLFGLVEGGDDHGENKGEKHAKHPIYEASSVFWAPNYKRICCVRSNFFLPHPLSKLSLSLSPDP